MLNPSHLAALTALFIAQPVFDLLLQYPQYFIASGATFSQVVSLAIVLVSVPWVCIALLLRLAPWMSTPMLLLFATLLSGQLLNSLHLQAQFFWLWPLAIAAFTILFHHTRFIPSLLAALSPAAIVLPLWFVYQVSDHPHLNARYSNVASTDAHVPGNPLPIFFLVLDELPRYSLVQTAGEVDSVRFPNFAKLAATSNWYYNAHTVADSTEVALPALLTGVNPSGETLPASLSAHPNNLFVALAPHLQINVQEPITRLCPAEVCGDTRNALGQPNLISLSLDASLILAHRSLPVSLRQKLPPIDESWSGFLGLATGHKQYAAGDPRFKFLEQVATASANSFNFAHIYLPHVPWKYMPSGRAYATAPAEYKLEGAAPGQARFIWRHDLRSIALGYQRHLLQTAYTDHWLGQWMDAIKARGLWDDALIIVTSDHGLSFQAGTGRRWVEARNLADIASVPLFIKYPGQQSSSLITAAVQTTDIAATIASVMDWQSWWPMDGIDLRNQSALETRASTLFQAKEIPPAQGFVRHAMTPASLAAHEVTTLRRQLFGPPLKEQGLFDISTDRRWLGESIETTGLAGISVKVDKLVALENYNQNRNRKLPAHLKLRFSEPTDSKIGIALNGSIRATTTTFSHDRQRAAVVLDEEFFSAAGNRLKVYLMTDGAWESVSMQ